MLPTTLKGKGMDTYIRISREGYRSEAEVEAQLDRYRRDCAIPGTEGGEVVTETDVSGTLAVDAREYGRLIDKVESGDSDGIVSPDVDRAFRNAREGLAAWDRVTAAGGRLVFPLDGIDSAEGDPDIAWERFVDRLRNGEAFARRQGKKLTRVAAESVERGIHAGSIPPLGYRWPGTCVDLPNGKTRFKKAGPLEPTADAPKVAAAFAAFDAGASWRELVRLLGVGSQGAARNVLTNDVYLGIARGGGTSKAEAHEAIVDPALFARVQRKLADRAPAKGKPRVRRNTAPLSAVLKCATCGHNLRHEAAKGHYRCKNMNCDCRVSVKAETSEAHVLALAVDHHAASHEAVAMALAVEDAVLPALEVAVIEAQAEVLAIEADETLSPLRKGQAATAADAALEAARRALDNAEATQGWHCLSPDRVADKLAEGDPLVVNEFIREMLTATVLPANGSRHLSIEDRIRPTTLVAGKLAAERMPDAPLRELARVAG